MYRHTNETQGSFPMSLRSRVVLWFIEILNNGEMTLCLQLKSAGMMSEASTT